MFTLRDISEKEMSLVSGGWFLSSDAGPGGSGGGGGGSGGSWWGSTSNPFDVTLGSTSSGWTFGASYSGGQFGIFTTSPSGAQTFHAYENGTVGGTFNVPIGGNDTTINVEFGPDNSSISIGWSW